jgi:hypothetical protein
MNILETQFVQRAYDGKWEKLAKVMDYDNKYVYKSESGSNLTYIPTKWMTVGVYDMLVELE